MGIRYAQIAGLLVLCAAGFGTAVADDAPAAVEHIEQATLLKYLADNRTLTLIDARSAEEYAIGHILGARNVPHDGVAAHAAELPADLAAPIVVYCKTGKRATQLATALAERGYSNVRVLGPAQLFWSDTAPMFNCGVEAPAEPEILSRKQP